jgi:hypothetical protein
MIWLLAWEFFSRDQTNACTDLVLISIDYNTICSHCRISICEIVFQIVYSSCMLRPVFCSNPRTRVQFWVTSDLESHEESSCSSSSSSSSSGSHEWSSSIQAVTTWVREFNS